MKISVIHNLYEKNKWVNESVQYNVIALENANIDYQYILFNDKGNKEIYNDIKDLLTDKVEYHYSDINYGSGKCSGGWVGAIPLIKGDIIHNTGQDDVFTDQFYQEAIKTFENQEMMFFTNNGIKAIETMDNQVGPLIHQNFTPDYEDPISRFCEWFGIVNNEVTAANNAMLAPGTMYRRKLHDLIGKPSVDMFFGACDFEYWARILFYGYKGKYNPIPYWLYRESNYSTSQKENDFENNVGPNIEKIKQKYRKLWKEKMQL